MFFLLPHLDFATPLQDSSLARAGGAPGLQPDSVADIIAAALAALNGHALRDGDGADAPRLRAHDAAAATGGCARGAARGSGPVARNPEWATRAAHSGCMRVAGAGCWASTGGRADKGVWRSQCAETQQPRRQE